MNFYFRRGNSSSPLNQSRSHRKGQSPLGYSRLEARQLLAIDVSGPIDVDTTWDDPEGYRIVGSVEVNSGVTLTIAPGIEVTETSVANGLRVNGTIVMDDVTFDAKLFANANTATVNMSNSRFSGEAFQLLEDASGSITGNVFTGLETLALDDSELSFGLTTFKDNFFSNVELMGVSPTFGDQLVDNTFAEDSRITIYDSSHIESHLWPVENVTYTYATLMIEANTSLTLHPGVSIARTGPLAIKGTLNLNNATITAARGFSGAIDVQDGGVLRLENGSGMLTEADFAPPFHPSPRRTRVPLWVSDDAMAMINDSVLHNFAISVNGNGQLDVNRSHLTEDARTSVSAFDIYNDATLNMTDSIVSLFARTSGLSSYSYSKFESLVEVYGVGAYSTFNNAFLDEVRAGNGDSSRTLEFRDNYWGTADFNEIADKITDHIDNPDLPLVDYSPFLNSSPLIHGTTGDDVVSIVVGAGSYEVTVNDDVYERDIRQPLRLIGFGGNDSVDVQLSDTDDVVESKENLTTIRNMDMRLELSGFEDVEIDAGGGDDSGTFYTPSNDGVFRFRDDIATVGGATGIGTALNTTAIGFEELNVHATQEGYRAVLWGSVIGDSFVLGRGNGRLSSGGGTVANFFEFSSVVARGNGGFDTAIMLDSEQNDAFFSRKDQAYLSNADRTFASVFDFDRVSVRSEFGHDTAFIEGTTGDDSYYASLGTSQLLTGDKLVAAVGFAEVTSRSGQGGDDSVVFNGTNARETFVGTQTFSSLTDGTNVVKAVRYSDVTARSNGGNDIAHLSDSEGDDTLYLSPDLAVLQNDSVSITATQFPHVYTNASSGNDTATFRDSDGNDTFVGRPGSGLMTGAGFENFALGFDQYSATATLGLDIARFFDSMGNESLFINSQSSTLIGNEFRLDANAFDRTIASSVGGDDEAYMTDTEENDFLRGSDLDVWMFNSDYLRFVSGFETVSAGAINGGVNRINLDPIEFELTTYGDWI